MNTTKIIKGVVNSGRYTVTAPIIKEDYGLYLQIEGVELPQTYEVDFSNSEHSGTSVTMIGNTDGVLIPHQFIDTGKDIFAFLYHIGEDFGRTVYKFRIPNKVRPDRTDIEPTPAEQSTIDQLIGALNSAVEQTGEDVESADQSARESAESARASGESALSASNSALSSGEYASNALGYAESASASAGTASAAATSASASAASAYADAERAEQAASTAGYLDVEIVDGRLIYTRTDAVDVDFSLNNGRLIMEAI